ncbi:hypothetical protein [Spirosoma endbachense]|uniref:Uncharacterized protein n=1 Tax=Spirosoma endbachense TaxID=2666025 RepID=A0A6P1W1M8_9BACT|nr:hypothetical protein [Spirosoma endbachense]QHV97576.1 hypothetical protein GJR95_22330 [Spirosoma endbachense]
MSIEEKAIKAFEYQLEELDNVTDRMKGRIWADFTVGIIKKYLGDDSNFLTHTSVYSIFYDKWQFDSDIRLAKELIRNCIKYIEINGSLNHLNPIPPIPVAVSESPKINFLYRISESWAIALITAIAGILYGAGFFIGDYTAKNRIDEERIKLKIEVQKLQLKNSSLVAQLNKIKKSNTSMETSNSKLIRRDQFKNWPFTVEQGILKCENNKVTFEANGIVYGVNGLGSTYAKNNGGRDTSEIWAVDEKATKKLIEDGIPKENATTYINISEVLDYGLSLCK